MKLGQVITLSNFRLVSQPVKMIFTFHGNSLLITVYKDVVGIECKIGLRHFSHINHGI